MNCTNNYPVALWKGAVRIWYSVSIYHIPHVYISVFGSSFMAIRFQVILVIDHSFVIEISGLVRARAIKIKQMRTFPDVTWFWLCLLDVTMFRSLHVFLFL